MKKLLVVVCTLMLSVSAMAQQTIESQIAELKQKIEAQQQQLNGLSQRVSEVEQLNVDLRKAMDFGKAITTTQGSNGVTYKLISLKGNKAEKTITAVFQMFTTNEMVDMVIAGYEASYVDLYGERQKTENLTVGNDLIVRVFKDTPTNGRIIFNDVDIDKVREIKLLRFDVLNGENKESVMFKDLKVEWK
ncbi:hypothetical protein [Hoylesella buccalis]|uniref:hypothetical protein n=1 Tax=Hoylesella buccalis TaxID=28127 RepID=UPI0026F20E4E|nr:hypothetical protein [Hoylesella buccalis]